MEQHENIIGKIVYVPTVDMYFEVCEEEKQRYTLKCDDAQGSKTLFWVERKNIELINQRDYLERMHILQEKPKDMNKVWVKHLIKEQLLDIISKEHKAIGVSKPQHQYIEDIYNHLYNISNSTTVVFYCDDKPYTIDLTLTRDSTYNLKLEHDISNGKYSANNPQ